MSSFYNQQDTGGPIAIKDEGITLVASVRSIDFTGAGVTGSALGDAVTETIAGGGGGSTILAATGTVNGVNTSFTFSSAPNVIVVDGRPLQKTQSDGGVNWTGTTSVTLSVAPNFDIYGY